MSASVRLHYAFQLSLYLSLITNNKKSVNIEYGPFFPLQFRECNMRPFKLYTFGKLEAIFPHDLRAALSWTHTPKK